MQYIQSTNDNSLLNDKTSTYDDSYMRKKRFDKNIKLKENDKKRQEE